MPNIKNRSILFYWFRGELCTVPVLRSSSVCVQHKALLFYSCIGNADIYTWLISFSDLNATASPTAGTWVSFPVGADVGGKRAASDRPRCGSAGPLRNIRTATQLAIGLWRGQCYHLNLIVPHHQSTKSPEFVMIFAKPVFCPTDVSTFLQCCGATPILAALALATVTKGDFGVATLLSCLWSQPNGKLLLLSVVGRRSHVEPLGKRIISVDKSMLLFFIGVSKLPLLYLCLTFATLSVHFHCYCDTSRYSLLCFFSHLKDTTHFIYLFFKKNLTY